MCELRGRQAEIDVPKYRGTAQRSAGLVLTTDSRGENKHFGPARQYRHACCQGRAGPAVICCDWLWRRRYTHLSAS